MLICQLTDLHVRPPGLLAAGVADTNGLTERALRAVAGFSPQPDLVLITGDLTDHGLAEEYDNLSAMLRQTLSMPVHVIPGNHDRRDILRARLGHLPGVTTDPRFVQYAVDDQPVRLIMLDTLVPGAAHGQLSGAQLQWLDRRLAAQPEKPTLVGMHHPPFATGIPHMDRIGFRDVAAFGRVIARHRQVRLIVCGHHHRPIVGHCGRAVLLVAPSVAHQVELTFDPSDPGAFNFEPPAFLLHLWTKGSGFVSHTVYTERYGGPFPFGSNDNPAADAIQPGT